MSTCTRSLSHTPGPPSLDLTTLTFITPVPRHTQSWLNCAPPAFSTISDLHLPLIVSNGPMRGGGQAAAFFAVEVWTPVPRPPGFFHTGPACMKALCPKSLGSHTLHSSRKNMYSDYSKKIFSIRACFRHYCPLFPPKEFCRNGDKRVGFEEIFSFFLIVEAHFYDPPPHIHILCTHTHIYSNNRWGNSAVFALPKFPRIFRDHHNCFFRRLRDRGPGGRYPASINPQLTQPL